MRRVGIGVQLVQRALDAGALGEHDLEARF
jgi:hypothetical protein